MILTDSPKEWPFAERSPFPLVKHFVTRVLEHRFPSLSGSTLYISSDYSGASRQSRFSVISMLFMDLENSRAWGVKRRAVRACYLADGRRMSFKDLNDSRRRQALIPFLSAADEIHGISVSIAFDKRIQRLFAFEGMLEDQRFCQLFQGRWKSKGFEEMLRVVHFVALFIAGFSRENQHVYWISDEGEFFDTPQKARDTARMLGTFTQLYVPHKLGELGLGTTKLDEGDRLEEDLASIPDLLAGSWAEMLTSMLKCYGSIPAIPVILENSTSNKTGLITEWACFSRQKLKKIACLFERVSPKQYRMGVFWLDDPEYPKAELLI